MVREQSILLGFPEYEAAARRLAAEADIPYASVEIHEFPDGESLVRLPSELPGNVIFCRSLNQPNSKLIELELAAAAARELGADRLTLVAPYLCYMRQDRAFNAGEAISQRIIGRFLARHFDGLLTVDPHLHRTPRLGDAVPVEQAISISAAPVMAQWLASLPYEPTLVAPDEEAKQWVSAIAQPAGLSFAVATKTRFGDRRVQIALPDIVLQGRHMVIVDDVLSTGRTIVEAARLLLDGGAASVSALVTHALFADDAVADLERAGINEIHSTDSVPHMTNSLTLAATLSDALSRFHWGG
jgi:ribose-phosphate pyrophosphokinase